jgi:hypothetical protein
MSEWFYIGLAYGLTYVVLAGYGFHLRRRYHAARAMAARTTIEGGAG